MKTYVVGGAVRDRLLGLPVIDRDHVVVGATVDEMIALGFKPVGRDFPVFLHPETREEYALARTERKIAPGYAGFVFHADPTVTLENDLARRDLTINAIACDEETGALIDPFGGRADLDARVFRHVGPAFAEDPVRVLRLARFAARFVDFAVADATRTLMRRMSAAGEIDALVPERVWQEVARGLMEKRPSRMFAILTEAEALGRLLPEVVAAGDDAWQATLAAVDRAADDGASLDVRFAVLVHRVVDRAAIDALAGRLALPRSTRDLALLVVQERDALRRVGRAPADAADAFVAAMERADGFRRAPRFDALAAAVVATVAPDERPALAAGLAAGVAAARSVDASKAAKDVGYEPSRIGPHLHAARVAAVATRGRDDADGPHVTALSPAPHIVAP